MPSGSSPSSAVYCAGGMPSPNSDAGLLTSQRTKRFSKIGANRGLENLALLVDRACRQDFVGLDAIGPGKKVGPADELAEQSATVKIPGESTDPAPTNQVAPFPVSPGRFIEARRDEFPVRGDIF